MENTPADKGVEELSLMLMYLLRMSETIPGLDEPHTYAWKGYEWTTMDELEKQGFIGQSRKMVHFTDEGIDRARELLARYGIDDWAPVPKK